MLHYIVCADVGALYFMRLDIWLFKITDDPSLALFTSGCCMLNVRDELRLRWKHFEGGFNRLSSVLSAVLSAVLSTVLSAVISAVLSALCR